MGGREGKKRCENEERGKRKRVGARKGEKKVLKMKVGGRKRYKEEEKKWGEMRKGRKIYGEEEGK